MLGLPPSAPHVFEEGAGTACVSSTAGLDQVVLTGVEGR